MFQSRLDLAKINSIIVSYHYNVQPANINQSITINYDWEYKRCSRSYRIQSMIALLGSATSGSPFMCTSFETLSLSGEMQQSAVELTTLAKFHTRVISLYTEEYQSFIRCISLYNQAIMYFLMIPEFFNIMNL